MRVLLRIIAALTALGVFTTAWFALWFWSTGRMPLLLTSPALAIMTLAGWAIVLTVGPVAAVQLWRFKPVGLRLSALLFAIGSVYYLGGIFVRTPDARLSGILAWGLGYAAVVGVLLLPASRRACGLVLPN